MKNVSYIDSLDYNHQISETIDPTLAVLNKIAPSFK